MRSRFLAPLLFLSLALAACGGTGTSAAPSAPGSDAPTTAPSTDPSIAPSDGASAAPSGDAGAGTQVEVVGTDYAYSGLEASYSGPITIAFRNDGAEVHEIVVFRRNEGVTQSIEELLAMPEEEAQNLVTFTGVAFAGPGETAPETITVAEPGQYVGICFVPQGTTEMPSIDPNSSEPPDLGAGAPHFTLGMVTEFEITQ